MSVIIPDCCALCAIDRIVEQNAAMELERALEFRALSAEWFAPNEIADKHAVLEDLDETIQSEADHLAKCEANHDLYDIEFPYEPRLA